MVALVMAIDFFAGAGFGLCAKTIAETKIYKVKKYFFMKFNFSVDENLLLTYHSGTISLLCFYRLGISFLASSENSIF